MCVCSYATQAVVTFMPAQGGSHNFCCTCRATWTRSCSHSVPMSQNFKNWNFRCFLFFFSNLKSKELIRRSSLKIPMRESAQILSSASSTGLPRCLWLFHQRVQNLPAPAFGDKKRIWNHFGSVTLREKQLFCVNKRKKTLFQWTMKVNSHE